MESTLTLREKLKNWFVQYSPSVKCCNSLLKILNEENMDVPSSVGGLIKREDKCVVRTVAPGNYIHIGLEKQLQKITKLLLQHSTDELLLDIGIDGIPLFKSSAIGLWPIFSKIVDEPQVDVFLIGTYVGKGKPVSVNVFLHDFVEELKSLSNFKISNRTFKIKIRAFVCDTPARSFLCGTKGHNALNGCHRCKQVGTRIGHRTVFSDSVGPRRTDQNFRNRSDISYHKAFDMEAESILENFQIGMVTQFPLDCMHLLDLGVTKKILNLLITNKTNQKFSPSTKASFSSVLVSFSNFISMEFARKPRTFDEIARWKATEYRQIALYTGIVLLRDFVDSEFYNHFLLFVVGYRIFVGSEIFSTNITHTHANEMFEEFVKKYSIFYGNLSYNIHNMLHVGECYKIYGNIMSISAYHFENFLQKIKRSVKMPKHIDKQIFNNFSETSIILPQENKFVKKNKNVAKMSKCNKTQSSNNGQLIQMIETMQRKLDILTENDIILKKQMKENHDILTAQLTRIQNHNDLFLNTLCENTIAIKNTLKDKNPKHTKMFPISTLKELKQLEENICDENEKEYISSVRAITGNRGLMKGLSDIISPKLLVDFNVDGSHNKERFLNFPRLVNVLFHGTYDENFTERSNKISKK
ncbi:uncharacterized protein LOC124420169 isoform X1 [Lucilia cuprina]|uniref:uncharacterized protein LOC124420169 isoform X1 n=2 Tax=Lucilia cuprina TaxID=7375 RepID=UPI001F070130|nr:uncharacterized protein LOC124420169 isoform X1 [Lucilia cuprina]